MFKVGSQLFTSAGPDFTRALTRQGAPVFLDLKYHDIPNTVASAVAAAAEPGRVAARRPRARGPAR